MLNEETKTNGYISHSRIQTYIMCPQKFYYTYVLQVPIEEVPEALVFGRHLHYAVAEFYRHWQKTGSKMPLEGFQETFVDGWREEPAQIAWKKGNNRENLQEKALEMLRVFHENREPGEIIAVESKFRVPIFDPETGETLDKELSGVVDLVEKGPDGQITLVEFKSSARSYNASQIEHSHQPTLYVYGLWVMELVEIEDNVKVRYDVMTKAKQPKFQQLETTRNKEDINKTIELIKQITRAIDLGVFYRIQGWQCSDCQFKAICK